MSMRTAVDLRGHFGDSNRWKNPTGNVYLRVAFISDNDDDGVDGDDDDNDDDDDGYDDDDDDDGCVHCLRLQIVFLSDECFIIVNSTQSNNVTIYKTNESAK